MVSSTRRLPSTAMDRISRPFAQSGRERKRPRQYLLDGLRVQRNAWHVLSKRSGANILQPRRRCPDKHDAAFDGGC